jgi:predicted nuclease with TOPRIM domain
MLRPYCHSTNIGAQSRLSAGFTAKGYDRSTMAAPQTLTQALNRLDKALAKLEDAVDRTVEVRAEFKDAEEEVQRLNSDRARLAGELDTSEGRAERLEEVNKEVSRRLVTAMETIRAVLDK